MTVDNNEFTRIDRVAVVPLEDVSKLLMPLPVVSNRVNNHDLGVVCQAVAGALLCSVWDLVVYQVPPIALDWDIFKSVYAIFRSSSPGEHLFIGYYGVEELTEEDGAGIGTPPGVPNEETEEDGFIPMMGEPDEDFTNFLYTIEDDKVREQALSRWHWDNDHPAFSRWMRYKYKLEIDNPKYEYYLTPLPFGEDVELYIKLMKEYFHTVKNLDDPYHLTY